MAGGGSKEVANAAGAPDASGWTHPAVLASQRPLTPAERPQPVATAQPVAQTPFTPRGGQAQNSINQYLAGPMRASPLGGPISYGSSVGQPVSASTWHQRAGEIAAARPEIVPTQPAPLVSKPNKPSGGGGNKAMDALRELQAETDSKSSGKASSDGGLAEAKKLKARMDAGGQGKYTSFKDMFDGGGAGKSGGAHEGLGILSDYANKGSNLLGRDNVMNTGSETKRQTEWKGGGVVKNQSKPGGSKKKSSLAKRTLDAARVSKAKADAKKKYGFLATTGRNMGGPISAYNTGGIAQSMLREEQIAQQQRQAPPAGRGGGGSPLAGVGMQIGKKLLGSALGPLGGVLGGLFNDGGKVDGMSPDTFINGKIASKHYPTPGPARNGPMGLNAGGAAMPHPNAMVKGPLNPMGYNEGGSAGQVPIKREMDMAKLETQEMMDAQKLQQAERAFEAGEARKDLQMQQAMKQKEESHAAAMKMKKDSAMMQKKKAAAGPLSGDK